MEKILKHVNEYFATIKDSWVAIDRAMCLTTKGLKHSFVVACYDSLFTSLKVSEYPTCNQHGQIITFFPQPA